jgi:hypothetical protein
MSEDIQRTLGSIETKVDMLLQRTEAVDGRVGKLEKWQNRVIGAYAFLIAVIGFYLKMR